MIRKYIRIFLATGCLLLQALSASAQDATVYTTTGNASQSLAESNVTVANTSMTMGALVLDPTQKVQRMDGFGFALTYSSCFNLMKMSAADRHDLLVKTYSETSGYGVSYARISIGCSDFSSTEYTLCDAAGLEHFRLFDDELKYVIPILKEILAINPKLKIIASPWTCPVWMKVDDLATKKPHTAWTDGHLNPDYYQTYADYFVKFINAFKEYGINIYAVTPQNEPLNAGNCASTYMPADEEAAFVKVMAATFKQDGVKTKIYVYDHNYDKYQYPIQVYNTLGTGYEGSEYVVGSAFHDYAGSSSLALNAVHSQFPDKDLIFTESSIGTWNDGHNLSTKLIDDMKNITFGTVNNYCNAVIVWNFMLDDRRGPNLDGGCTTCYGAVDINSGDYKTLSYNSHYYIICHMASVVSPDAVCIKTNSYSQAGLTYSAFLNPDGTASVVMLNENSGQMTVPVSDGIHRLSVSLPGRSVVSCKWVYNASTAIKNINSDKKVIDNYYYNLQGMRMYKPIARGLYVFNGKKIVVN
jgi:glucosylceramidase